MSDVITSHLSVASITAVSMMLSSAAVGLAESSLVNHYLVGFPLKTILPLMDLSRFSVRNIKACCALRLSIGNISAIDLGVKQVLLCNWSISFIDALRPSSPKTFNHFWIRYR
jgi:hypothetical protein